MSEPQCTTGVRWLARVLAIAVVGFVLVIYIGEGGFNPLRLTPGEAASMVLFWAAVIGLLVAWRWELIGGALTVGGMLLFYALHWLLAGTFPSGWAFALIALPGLLYLACAAWDRRRIRDVASAQGASS